VGPLSVFILGGGLWQVFGRLVGCVGKLNAKLFSSDT